MLDLNSSLNSSVGESWRKRTWSTHIFFSKYVTIFVVFSSWIEKVRDISSIQRSEQSWASELLTTKRVKWVCISIINSGSGLSPAWNEFIAWNNTDLLSIGP